MFHRWQFLLSQTFFSHNFLKNDKEILVNQVYYCIPYKINLCNSGLQVSSLDMISTSIYLYGFWFLLFFKTNASLHYNARNFLHHRVNWNAFFFQVLSYIPSVSASYYLYCACLYFLEYDLMFREVIFIKPWILF